MQANGIDPQIVVACISAAAGIIATIITVKYKDRVIKKQDKPKDRMETIFDGYEKLIVSQQEEISRKSRVIGSLEKVVDRLQDELDQTRGLLQDAREELEESTRQNNELTIQLRGMKKDYSDEQTRLSKVDKQT